RPRILVARFLGVGNDMRADALYQRMRQPLLHRALAPGAVLVGLASLSLVGFGKRDQPLRAVGTTVEHDVLDVLAQYRIELIVDAELAGVDDSHRQARADGVVEKDGVDGLAHRVVATEAEADVGDASGYLRMRKVPLDPRRGANEIDGIVCVLVDAGRDRKHVWIDDDVLGREVG